MFKFFSLIFIVFFTISCSNTKPDRLITGWSDDINRSDLSIPTEQDLQIRVYANYDDGSKEDVSKNLTWYSSDKNIATVENGLVTANNQESDVNITYEIKEKIDNGSVYKVSTTFNILKLTLKSLTISPNSLKIFTTKTANLSATANFEENSNNYPNYSCNWSSSDESIVTVDESGTLKGVTEGNATITAFENNIKDTSDVEVINLTYTALQIKEPSTTTFNVKQTIQLIAQGVTDKNITVDLESDEVIWHSDKDGCIRVNEDGLATAIRKCESVISASFTLNTDLKDSIVLDVLEEEYLRIFKDDVEISFSYQNLYEDEEIPDELSTFKLIAVGKDFVINDVSVKNFNGNLLYSAYFDILDSNENLTSGYIIEENKELSFELIHDGEEEELHYYFTIDDKSNSSFSQKYLKEIP